MDLIISRDDSDGRCVLNLRGALDLANRDTLLDIGRTALGTPGIVELVLHAADVEFLDSTGLGAIVTLANATEDAGCAFALAAPSDRVVRVLTISGLLDAWPITPSPGC